MGGSTVADTTFTESLYGRFPLLLALISAITLVVVSWVLRSLVPAIKAVLMNLVSLRASSGFMVCFWQEKQGLRWFYGSPPTGTIQA